MFRFSRIITSKITKRRSWQVVYQVQIPYKKGTRKSLCKPTDTAFGSLSTLKQSSRNDDMMPDFGLVNLLLMKLSGTFVSSSLFKWTQTVYYCMWLLLEIAWRTKPLPFESGPVQPTETYERLASLLASRPDQHRGKQIILFLENVSK